MLDATADKPERAAFHFALLRSFKQATYSPIQDEHYALASHHYCHFTSPIRRYPDLQVHRLLDKWVPDRIGQREHGGAGGARRALLEEERRAETAERELVKTRILSYLSGRLGEQLDAVITGVADYGFFAQAERFPAEGLVHISSLVDDYYWFDESAHSLEGRRTQRRFRLGDRVRVVVARVDLPRRMLDLRLAERGRKTEDDGGDALPLPAAPRARGSAASRSPRSPFTCLFARCPAARRSVTTTPAAAARRPSCCCTRSRSTAPCGSRNSPRSPRTPA